jgi:histone acetyltransferase (RNA polymerase elongator complex component)
MIALLDAAKPFLPGFKGIRISTRPDYINKNILSLLKSYGVTSIELGAQSMDNSVLELNERGHTEDDVVNASRLIRNSGFSLGLQMMTGLYGATPETDIYTARRFIELRPDTVRVYPTVIMKNTALAQLYERGVYKPYSLDTSVDLCAKLILMFENANIQLIRLGLHYSDSLEQNSLGGNYHPAFKELCENKIFYDSFIEKTQGFSHKKVNVIINPKSISKFLGQRKSNIIKLQQSGYDIHISFDSTKSKYGLEVMQCV